jgi:hypothetical protein
MPALVDGEWLVASMIPVDQETLQATRKRYGIPGLGHHASRDYAPERAARRMTRPRSHSLAASEPDPARIAGSPARPAPCPARRY